MDFYLLNILVGQLGCFGFTCVYLKISKYVYPEKVSRFEGKSLFGLYYNAYCEVLTFEILFIAIEVDIRKKTWIGPDEKRVTFY